MQTEMEVDAIYSAELDRAASCHYGDHFWQNNGYCSNCHAFNGGLLQWRRFEKADKDGTLIWHGSPDLTPDEEGFDPDTHYHFSQKAAEGCRLQ